MKDYTQKMVFIGIDVHKKTYAVTAICDKEIVKRDTLAAYPESLVKYIKKFFVGGTIKTAYEAGFSGFHLHRFLIANGIDNIVIHPAAIKVAANDRVKTDKRDSLKIAKSLAEGELRGILVPSEQRENFRELTRKRDKLLEDRKRAGNQLKSLLFRHGLIAPDDDRVITKKWLDEVKKLNVAKDIKLCIDLDIETWLYFDGKIRVILEELHKQAKEDAQIDTVYRKVPGIGALSARVLANELGDMSQFSNEKKLFSFTGLTPSEHSSGQHRWLGHISRQGRPILRKILVQIAWRAIKQDTGLKTIFERISSKTGRKRAIVAISRKLIGKVRSCFVSGEIYKIMKANAPINEESLTSKVEAC